MSLSNNHNDTDRSNSVIQVFWLYSSFIFFQDKFFQMQSLSAISDVYIIRLILKCFCVPFGQLLHSQRFLDEN